MIHSVKRAHAGAYLCKYHCLRNAFDMLIPTMMQDVHKDNDRRDDCCVISCVT